MNIGRQLLFCDAGLVLVRLVVWALPPNQVSAVDSVWVLINQWMALGYFWFLNRFLFDKESA